MVNEPSKSVLVDNVLEKIKCLGEISKEIAEEFAKQHNLHQQLKTEYETLLQDLFDLVKHRKQQLLKEQEYTKYMPEDSFDLKMITDKLKQFCDLLGYFHSFDSAMEIVTFHYQNECSVKFKLSDPYELIEIRPAHSSFDIIKDSFEKTNDIIGVLSALREFFDYVIESIKA